MTKVNWAISESTSCFHAIDALRQGNRFLDEQIARDLHEPLTRLQSDLFDAGIDETVFWMHLLPLSVGIGSNRQLAELSIRKAAGDRGDFLVDILSRRITECEEAYRAAVSHDFTSPMDETAQLREKWEATGPTLLAAISRLTEDRLLIPQVDVVLVPPVVGSGGAAHLYYNSVRIESESGSKQNDQTWVVHLAWLIVQLRLTLPDFAEQIRRENLRRIGGLALLAVCLSAGQGLELITFDASATVQCARAWQVTNEVGDVEKLLEWWAAYATNRPTFQVGLAAIDEMLNGSR